MDMKPGAALDLHTATVRREWLDYNEHMNVTWYTKVFDDAGEMFMRAIGMGEDYTRVHRSSWVILEAHTCYLAEARLDERLRVTGRVLAHDAKRVHLFLELDGEAGPAATCEMMIMHVDLDTRRSAPFPAPTLLLLESIAAEHARLPAPERAARVIALPGARG